MEQLEINDIQGIIIRGYTNLPAAEFILLAIENATAAKQWLSGLSKEITPGNHKPENIALHIAFSFSGLQALGLDKTTLDSFPIELEDGMITEHKQFFLGDFEKSAPQYWEWGGINQQPVHALLMIYAKDSSELEKAIKTQKEKFGNAVKEIRSLDTTVLAERKEHFGFRDGISQPTIKGLSRVDANGENAVNAGEFILGYKNEYDQYPPEPKVAASMDTKNILPAAAAEGLRSLGMNGSYLVFRHLKQDVSSFWKYMAKATANDDGSVNETAMIKLAAQMVGRWPGGAPVVLYPDAEEKKISDYNQFDYRSTDPDGQKCPLASHIRRSNPKDALDATRSTSIAIAKRHRILRRGRSYGQPLSNSMKPMDCVNAANSNDDRGLYFICINSDIGRQFEFIQNAWINNEKFNGLYEERDPITGNHHYKMDNKTTGIFNVPCDGLRKRYTDIPEFVTVKGGAYFFLPGMKALQFLSTF